MIAYSTSYGKRFPIRELCWWEEPITNSGRIFVVIHLGESFLVYECSSVNL